MTKPEGRRRGPGVCAAMLCVALGLFAPTHASMAAEKVVVTGVLGSYTSGVWPFLIAMKKGFFARHGIKPDVVFVPTAPGLVQQLAAGSLDLIAVNGLVEPLHAVEKGAPVAIMRIIGQTPNYVMIGQPGIKNLSDLKGKKIAIGGLREHARIAPPVRRRRFAGRDFGLCRHVLPSRGARASAG